MFCIRIFLFCIYGEGDVGYFYIASCFVIIGTAVVTKITTCIHILLSRYPSIVLGVELSYMVSEVGLLKQDVR